MGLRHLFGLCFAFLSFSALASPVEVDRSGSKFSVNSRTMKVPGVAALSAAPESRAAGMASELIRKFDRGLYQVANAQLTLKVPDTHKTLTAAINGRVNVSTQGLKNSAKLFARSLPYLGIGLIVVEGIDYMIAGHDDWFFDDHGVLMKSVVATGGFPGTEFNTNYPAGYPESAPFEGAQKLTVGGNSVGKASGGSEALYNSAVVGSVYSQADCNQFTSPNSGGWSYPNCFLAAKFETNFHWNFVMVPTSYNTTYPPYDEYYLHTLSIRNSFPASMPYGGAWYAPVQPPVVEEFEPVTLAEFDALVDSAYDPAVSDWEHLAPYFAAVAEPSTYTVEEPIGGYFPEAVVTTAAAAEGDVVRSAEESFAMTVRNNSTAKPEIDVTYAAAVNAYQNGQLIDSAASTAVYAASLPDAGVNVYPDAVAGGLGGPGPFNFCTFAPIVCDWFAWYQSDDGLPPENPDEDIFLGIDVNELDISGFETIDMSFGGGASCPEPIQIHVTVLNRNIEITYDAWCSLADTARLLVLAVAWMSAVSIIIGGIRRS